MSHAVLPSRTFLSSHDVLANQSRRCACYVRRCVAFLSYLRLSVYMAVVAVAIILSFHLKNQPSPLELKIARPMGAIFWALSVASLGLGIANYISTPTCSPPYTC